LTCKNRGSCGSRPLEQDDERLGADAANTDDLAGHVHDLEALQQVAPIVLQGGPVGVELFADIRLTSSGDRP